MIARRENKSQIYSLQKWTRNEAVSNVAEPVLITDVDSPKRHVIVDFGKGTELII